MYFSLCEHYNNDAILIHCDDCFICFDYVINNEKFPIYLSKQQLYLNTCDCDGSVHISCLKKWFNKHTSCPICRVKFSKKEVAVDVIVYIMDGIRCWLFIHKMLIRCVNILLILVYQR